MRRLLLPLILAAIALSLAAPGPAAARRFDGYVGGVATGRGHRFTVGDGLNLVFIDRRRAGTPYRVCWHRLHYSHHRCWTRRTGPAGHRSRIRTAAPFFVGPYIVKWTVRRHRKAVWRFYDGVGD